MLHPVLILPGLGGSGPRHWQSLWEASSPDLRRVHQADWDNPDRVGWVAALEAAVAAAGSSVLLVAHSLACALVAHWAPGAKGRVAAALLVSPSDVEDATRTPDLVRGFAPLPLAQLSFPSVVVCSRNDPYVDFARGAACAAAWGSRLVDAGAAGHINADSGHGDWPEGQAILDAMRRENSVQG
jgi:predicted alpha/beta hydrolase family esterase